MKSPTRRTVLMGAVALAAAAAGAAAALFRYRVEPARHEAVEALFNQRLPDPDGNDIDMAQYRGKVLVVNFWATWCAPCVEEMPELSEIQQQTRAAGVQILGLAIDTADKVRAFRARLPVDYPLLILNAGGIDTARRFGNSSGALPFTVVVDRAGNIVEQTLGRFDRDALTKAIERANSAA